MILVTGGTGLVGSHLLLDLMKSGEVVRAIYRSKKSLERAKKVFSYSHAPEAAKRMFDSIEWTKADLADIPALEKAFEGINRVYHCAAHVSFDPSEDLKLRKTNIEGTSNIVNLCIKEQVEKLCYVSSIATFDKKPGDNEITEASQWNKEKDHSMYAITKYGAEMEVWRASQEGVAVVIVNPGVIIGPGAWDTGSGLIYKRTGRGLKYHFPKVTGFVGVNDVVKAMRQLMNSPHKNEQFILVAGNRSFTSILEKVARSIDRTPPTKELKPWMVFTGWIFEKLLKPLTGKSRQLSRQSSKTLFEETRYSSEKIRSQLGFEFEDMDDVITRTGMLYKKELTEL